MRKTAWSPRLAERVEELFGRVERLEGLWEGPGPAYLDSGNCVIAAVDPLQYKPVLQNESILKHMSQFDVIPQKYQLRSVQVDPGERGTAGTLRHLRRGSRVGNRAPARLRIPVQHRLEGRRGLNDDRTARGLLSATGCAQRIKRDRCKRDMNVAYARPFVGG